MKRTTEPKIIADADPQVIATPMLNTLYRLPCGARCYEPWHVVCFKPLLSGGWPRCNVFPAKA